MKIEVNEKAKQEEPEYPCLMEGTDGLVILMTNKSTGTVISPNFAWEIGEYSESWFGLKLFHGTITLSNE